MSTPSFVPPASAEELGRIAAETGAEVFRAPLRYPSDTGGWQLGDGPNAIDLSELLSKCQDCEITLIVAATTIAEKLPTLCSICGLELDQPADCPRRKLTTQETTAGIRRQQELSAAVLDEAQGILRTEDDD
ncbi:MAG: hypothetical protein E3J64_08775 [Anaerolineales bacterium]|nr:MAG: hypothetical protein E3J64_08775 [Anaerolineales bacterium]